MSPNPLKQIQEALEKVLHETGVTDFGRSMSSIDDLTAEVQHVYQRVDDIERTLETVVPILERLTVVFERIEGELAPISELASKVPGSGSRRRRREETAAAEAALVPAPTAALAATPHGSADSEADVPAAVAGAAGAGTTGGVATGGEATGGGADAEAAEASTAGPSATATGDAGSLAGSAPPRPGATGYSPLGRHPGKL